MCVVFSYVNCEYFIFDVEVFNECLEFILVSLEVMLFVIIIGIWYGVMDFE